MVVVWDKQPNGALPAWDAVFGTTDATGTTASDVHAAVRYDEMGRFSILHEKVIKLEPHCDGNAGTVYTMCAFDKYIKLKGKECVYSGATADIGSLNSGGIYVYFRKVETAAGPVTVSVNDNSFARLRYVD
jgi:hypothetical protein